MICGFSGLSAFKNLSVRTVLLIFLPKKSVGPFCAVIRGALRLDGLRAGALRRKGSFVFVTHLLQACYSMRKTRAISYVRARRLRRKGETFTS